MDFLPYRNHDINFCAEETGRALAGLVTAAPAVVSDTVCLVTDPPASPVLNVAPANAEPSK